MFLYLVQGRAAEIELLHQRFVGKCVVSLTWDEHRAGSIFFPNSTWSQGRRRLYQNMGDVSGIEYVVFMDGDVVISLNDLERFERVVLERLPAVAVPVCEKTSILMKYAAKRQWQLAYDSDEQFHAIHKNILCNYFGGSPYVSRYDDMSWWYPCVIMQNMLRRFLWRSFLQVNDVYVDNTTHGQYKNDFSAAYIDREVRRLGVRSGLPLSANGRGKGVFNLRWKLDKRIFKMLSLMSDLLYRPYNGIDLPPLPAEVKDMIGQA